MWREMNKETREKRESYSPGDVHFHYDREERYRYLSPEVAHRTKKRGLFKGNRGLIILLIDILLILLLYFILNPLLQGRASSSDFMGYEVGLRAFFYGDEVFVSLRFLADPSPADSVEGEPATDAEDLQEGPLVRVNFSLEDGDTRVEASDILPVRAGGERVIRARITPERHPESARAEVRIGDETLTLETDIRPEQE
jgi:hypothetical protein